MNLSTLRKTFLALFIILGVAQAPALPPGFADQLVIGGWDRAAGLAFAPDGRCFVWEKSGRVWLVEGGVKSSQPVIDIRSEVRDFADYGLLGLALDPNFLSNGRIYLLYGVDYYDLTRVGTPGYDPNQSNYARDSIGRLTRYTLNASNGFRSIVPNSRKVLVGETISTGFPMVHQSHGVGTLAFGEDGALFAGSGDSASFLEVDNGGPRAASSNTGVADGIIKPKEDVGAFRAQLPDSLAGKIIRVNPENGDGLPGNPYFDAANPRKPSSRVWLMGLRNPYRFSFRPNSATASNPAGVLYIGDVGWDSHEELNIARTPGLNFGWPIYEGLELNSGYATAITRNQDAPNPLAGWGCPTYFSFQDLLIQDSLEFPFWSNPCQPAAQIPSSVRRYVHARAAIEWGHGFPTKLPIYNGSQAATIDITNPNSPVLGSPIPGSCALGGIWYTGSAFGPEYQNTYFMGDFVSGTIKNLVLDVSDNLQTVRVFHETGGPVVCLAAHPQTGAMYYIGFSYTGVSSLRRIVRTENQLPVVVINASPAFGASPLPVQFSSAGSFDPEGNPLTYIWDFGDGSPASTSANPQHTYSVSGSQPTSFDVTVQISDGVNVVFGNTLVSVNNTPPEVAITSPISGVVETTHALPVTLSAIISDKQSPTNSLVCSWQRILHHNTHTHPEAPMPVCSAIDEISPHGSSGEFYYHEFVLTVTDPQGLSTTVSASVYPVACIGDLNSDQNVNDADFSIFIEAYNLLDCADPAMPQWCHADLNRDGVVDDADFSRFALSYDRLICP